jgi:hypothetical protein
MDESDFVAYSSDVSSVSPSNQTPTMMPQLLMLKLSLWLWSARSTKRLEQGFKMGSVLEDKNSIRFAVSTAASKIGRRVYVNLQHIVVCFDMKLF